MCIAVQHGQGKQVVCEAAQREIMQNPCYVSNTLGLLTRIDMCDLPQVIPTRADFDNVIGPDADMKHFHGEGESP